MIRPAQPVDAPIERGVVPLRLDILCYIFILRVVPPRPVTSVNFYGITWPHHVRWFCGITRPYPQPRLLILWYKFIPLFCDVTWVRHVCLFFYITWVRHVCLFCGITILFPENVTMYRVTFWGGGYLTTKVFSSIKTWQPLPKKQKQTNKNKINIFTYLPATYGTAM